MRRAQSEIHYLPTINNLSDTAIFTNEISRFSKIVEISRSHKAPILF